MADPEFYNIKDAAGQTVTFTPNADPAKGSKQDTGNTALASILAKIIAAPATESKQDTIITALAAIAGYVDGLEGKDFATQTTLAAVLAKIIAAPATEAKQDTLLARMVTQLGARTVAQSPAVNIATDQPAIPVDHSTTGIGHGHKEVTTAGTPLALASSTAAKWVTIQAYRANTGYIAIGGANTVSASATKGTGTGLSLAAGEAATFPCDNLADFWLDASVNGDGVRFTYGS